MESMVDGRALTAGDRGTGARATIAGSTLHDHTAAIVDRRGIDPLVGRWRRAAPGQAAHESFPADSQVGLRNGLADARSLDAIERLDHSSVSGAELLELLLCFGKCGPAAGRIARDLIGHFGSVGAVLAAQPSRLAEWLEGDQASVFLLKIVRVAVKTTLREPLEDRPVIGSASALMDYLSVTMRHEPIEATRVLFLDRKNALIKDEILHRGTIDHTPLYPREVVRRVIETGAAAIILVHNHPSGDPSPSQADIAMTKELMAALGTIGGVLHDHVIVGRNRELSFRKSGLI
ncbi:MAG TPA: DNA repair protein RadC [Geminicoccaceae bacterium]|nr:DNA repair protein RadC [Geminicoccaceae bacterium]